MSAIEERPIAGRCSRCHGNTAFEPDEDYPDILSSQCCGWPPLNIEDLPEEP